MASVNKVAKKAAFPTLSLSVKEVHKFTTFRSDDIIVEHDDFPNCCAFSVLSELYNFEDTDYSEE